MCTYVFLIAAPKKKIIFSWYSIEMNKKNPAKRTRQGKASKLVKRHLEEIVFVVDLTANSESLLRYVLARFKEPPKTWSVYKVAPSEKQEPQKKNKRLYWSLFTLSALGHLSSLKKKQEELRIDNELTIEFPLKADSPIAGPAVKYLHNIRGAKSDRYSTIPLDLRGCLHIDLRRSSSVQPIFKLTRDPRGSNYSKFSIDEKLAAEKIHFCDINNFPIEIFSGKSQIASENIILPTATVNPQEINDLVQKIVQSELWTKWGKGRKRKQKENRQETFSKKLSYFEPIERVLQIDSTGKSEIKDPVWFRQGGPLAIDFQKEHVYR